MRADIANSLKKIEFFPDKSGAHVEFCFDIATPIFMGHFPGNPLLPGVFQIEMVRIVVEKILGCEQNLESIGRTKFIRKILPGETITVDVRISHKQLPPSVSANLSVGKDAAAVISLAFGKRT